MRLISLVPALALFCAASSPAVPVETRVDWPSFLRRHDLVWETLPGAWHEGAFIGNGALGAMIYAEGTNTLQWDVNRSDVTDRGNRLQVGRFVLKPGASAHKGTMRLDLWNAEATGVVQTAAGSVAWQSLTHAGENTTFIAWRDRGQSSSQVAFEQLPAVPARDDFKQTPIPETERNPEPMFGATDGVSWCLQRFRAGGGYCVAYATRTNAPGEFLHAHTIEPFLTGPPDTRKAAAAVREALGEGEFPRRVKTHRAWWHDHWTRGAFLSLPDTRMESFYWIQMYKLASGTRADRPALDLMGPWFRRTPWPRIWWNLNIQLTYWPVYAANRLQLGESLIRMLDANTTNLVNNVPEAWRGDSAAIARTSTYDCRGTVSGRDGEERGNLIWTMHNYWLHYRHGGDEALLRERFYPLLKRTVGYFLHLLKPGPDGRLHMPVSLSPEYPRTAPDTNYDLALLRWGLETAAACDERLQLNDPFAARCRATLSQLAPPPIDPSQGYMIGAGQPLETSHRHFSHLFAIYPLHQLDFGAPSDRALAEKSLNHWIGFEGALQGYSFTGASAMSSWLGRSGTNVKLLNEFLDRFVKANTMYLEAGPVIETPLAGASAIHEILLQSWSRAPFGTCIRVFPAVPDDWPEATIDRMLAEGAFEISAERKSGRTSFVQIRSLAGNPCVVRTGLEEPVALAPARQFVIRTEKDGGDHATTTVDLKKGETVVLVSARDSARRPPVVAPVPPQPARLNYYGSRKVPPVVQSPDGRLTLPARAARLHGNTFFLQGTGDGMNIGRWTSTGDYASWRVRIDRPGTFHVRARYASTGNGSFALELFDGNGTRLGGLVAPRRGTGGWDKFEETEAGALDVAAPGTYEVQVRAADGRPPYLNLAGLLFTPK